MTDGYFVGINWNNDGGETGGDFSDVGEDVTDDVLARGPVTFQYGRDESRALAPPRVGSIGFTLCNADRLYSPENPNSPIANDVAPAARIKVEETIDGTTYPLMRGRIDTFKVNTRRGDRSVQITGFDDLSLLRGKKITTSVYQAQRTGSLIVAILDAAGAFFNAPRRIDPGATHVPWWWANNQDAFDLVTQLIRAEGPPAVAYVDPDGGFVFRDRHHRLLNPQSLVPQATFSDAPTVPLFDTFTRNVMGGWGTADTGQAWSTVGGTGTNYDVNGSVGRHMQTAVNTSLHTLIDSPGADVTVQTDVSVDQVPSGNSFLIYLMARAVGSTDAYLARFGISAGTGNIVLTLRKRIANVDTLLDTFVTGLSYVANSVYSIKLRIDGSDLMAKTWLASGLEPATWQVAATDTDLTSMADVGVRSLLLTGVTNPLPVVFSFDNFQATTPTDTAQIVNCP